MDPILYKVLDLLTKKTAKKLKKELIQLTNLQMGQFRQKTAS